MGVVFISKRDFRLEKCQERFWYSSEYPYVSYVHKYKERFCVRINRKMYIKFPDRLASINGQNRPCNSGQGDVYGSAYLAFHEDRENEDLYY